MVSRRRIISRSRENLMETAKYEEEEEDAWYNLNKLYKEHIQEVLDKWNQIDDEIWAKVIVFERNRRVAKAYARAPVLTINGSNDGFDGIRIGLCGFDNPMRDFKTEEAKRHISQGVKIRMDNKGNMMIKRLCRSNVYVRAASQEDNAIGSEITRNSQGALELEKPVQLFDMEKFQKNLSRETRRAYPDRRRLEAQCLSAIIFVRSEADLLQCPIWVLIINVVGLHMLKSKLPPVMALQRPVDMKNRPQIPLPDEDPYSIAGASGPPRNAPRASRNEPIYVSSRTYQQQQQQRREGPPQLPPRERCPHDIPKPDYDYIEDEYISKLARAPLAEMKKKSKKPTDKKYDDPYYCGLSARVPNFVKMANNRGQMRGPIVPVSARPHHHMDPHAPQRYYPGPPYGPQGVHHARSFESGLDSSDRDAPYNHIYGRLPIPTRGHIPPPPTRTAYIGEWD